MKKNTVLLTALLTLALFSSIVLGPEHQTATANPMIYRSFNASPIITVQSPENNTTVAPEGIMLVFNLSKPTEDLGGTPTATYGTTPYQHPTTAQISETK